MVGFFTLIGINIYQLSNSEAFTFYKFYNNSKVLNLKRISIVSFATKQNGYNLLKQTLPNSQKEGLTCANYFTLVNNAF